eukprot:TRINITY_DN3887_c0_g1_i3.p1 TRINITY_DN3887_c0_g1~~TRINITY_DN3887_c0_g1_i3.p1  ORF type:complete len:1813 (-),score=213.61 TRINITY_DN3887_c0_g1_i3:933-6371(-)
MEWTPSASPSVSRSCTPPPLSSPDPSDDGTSPPSERPESPLTVITRPRGLLLSASAEAQLETTNQAVDTLLNPPQTQPQPQPQPRPQPQPQLQPQPPPQPPQTPPPLPPTLNTTPGGDSVEPKRMVRSSWRLLSSSRDTPYRKFAMSVLLPSMAAPPTGGGRSTTTSNAVECEFPSKLTVEQIKSNLFANVPALFNLPKNNFVLTHGSYILEDQKRLVSSHEDIIQQFRRREKIKLQLRPRGRVSTLLRRISNVPQTYPEKALDTAPRVSGFATVRGHKSTFRRSRDDLDITSIALYDWNTTAADEQADKTVDNNTQENAKLLPSPKRIIGTIRRTNFMEQGSSSHSFILRTPSADAPASAPTTPLPSPGKHIPNSPTGQGRRLTLVSGHRNSFRGDPSVTPPVEGAPVRAAPEEAEVEEKPDSQLAGWLTKQGGTRKNWKRRWFVLTSDAVQYYNVDTDKIPIAEILLTDVFAAAPVGKAIRRNHGFAVYTRNRTFMICASTDDDMVRWVEAIKRSIFEQRHKKQLEGASESPLAKAMPVGTIKVHTLGTMGHKRWEGWLTVCPVGRARWKRQWCVLAMGAIYYYPDPLNHKWEGKIGLSYSSIEFYAQRPHSFMLYTAEKMDVFSADTEREMREWIVAISRARYSNSNDTGHLLPDKDDVHENIDWQSKEIVVRKTVIPSAPLYQNTEVQIAQIRRVLDLQPRKIDDAESVFFRTKLSTLYLSARNEDTAFPNHVVEATCVTPLARCAAISNYPRLNLFFYFMLDDPDAPSQDAQTLSTSQTLDNSSLADALLAADVDAELSNGKEDTSKTLRLARRCEYTILSCPAKSDETLIDALAQVMKKYKRIYMRNKARYTAEHPASSPRPGEAEANVNSESMDLLQEVIDERAYIIQIRGKREFIMHPEATRLDLVKYVNAQLARRNKIEFVLVKRSALAMHIQHKVGFFASYEKDQAERNTMPVAITDMVEEAAKNRRQRESASKNKHIVGQVPAPNKEAPNDNAEVEAEKEVEKKETQTETQIHTETQTETQVETQAETQAEAQAKTQVETQVETQTETRAEAQTESQTETQAETQTETRAEAQTESRTETQAEIQPEPQIETNTASEITQESDLSVVNQKQDPMTIARASQAVHMRVEQLFGSRISEVARPSLKDWNKVALSPKFLELCHKFEQSGQIREGSGLRSFDATARKEFTTGPSLEPVPLEETTADTQVTIPPLELHRPVTTLTHEHGTANGETTGTDNIQDVLPPPKTDSVPVIEPADEPQLTTKNEVPPTDAVPSTSNGHTATTSESPQLPRPMAKSFALEHRKHGEVKREDCYNIADMNDLLFSVKILALENMDDFFVFNPTSAVSIECGLYFGTMQLGNFRTPQTKRPTWSADNIFHSFIALPNLPREARLCLKVIAHNGREECVLGWLNLALFDYLGNLQAHVQSLSMWPGSRPQFPTSVANPYFDFGETPVLFVEFLCPPSNRFITYTFPTFSLRPAASQPDGATSPSNKNARGSFVAINNLKLLTPAEDELVIIKRVLATDCLYEMNNAERQLLWKYRELIRKEHSSALSKVLLAADWTDRDIVAQVHQLLKRWPKIEGRFAVELLDYRHPDSWVRTYACNCLNQLSDHDLLLYLPQLVQACKFELYHSSALAQLLLRRALANRLVIGYPLFWELKTAVAMDGWKSTTALPGASDSPENDEPYEDTSKDEGAALRYALMGEVYLRCCGEEQRQDIFQQTSLVEKLRTLSDSLKVLPKHQRDAAVRKGIANIEFPPEGLTLPIDPRIRVKGFMLDKCKSMDSFTVPLWLTFQNAEDTVQ